MKNFENQLALNPNIVPTDATSACALGGAELSLGEIRLRLDSHADPLPVGLFEPPVAKAVLRGLRALTKGNRYQALEEFSTASVLDGKDESVTEEVLAGLLLAEFGHPEKARALLELVAGSPVVSNPPDEGDVIARKYELGGTINVGISEEVTLEAPLGSWGAAVALAGCYLRLELDGGALTLIGALYMLRPDDGLLDALIALATPDEKGTGAVRAAFESGWERLNGSDVPGLGETPEIKERAFMSQDDRLRASAARAEIAVAETRAKLNQLESRQLDYYRQLRQVCEFMSEVGDWAGIRALAAGVKAEDWASAEVLLFYGRALEELGRGDAALEVYSILLRPLQRDKEALGLPPGEEVALEARYRRGCLAFELGRRSLARNDLATVYAQDPRYRDIDQILDRLDSKPCPSDRRETIPREAKDRVWRRDEGRCTECGSRERLEFDHVIPLALGGSNTERNLQLLCETCNRRKAAAL